MKEEDPFDSGYSPSLADSSRRKIALNYGTVSGVRDDESEEREISPRNIDNDQPHDGDAASSLRFPGAPLLSKSGASLFFIYYG